MADPSVDFRESVRAQVAAQEYVRASDNLAISRDYLLRERRVLRAMLALIALGTVAFFVAIMVPTFPDLFEYEEASGVDIAMSYAVISGISLLISLYVGCGLAGVIGMWRAISKSSWFIWGGFITMIFGLMLLCWIPLVFGPVFLARQAWRVSKAKRDLAGAEDRYRETSTVVA